MTTETRRIKLLSEKSHAKTQKLPFPFDLDGIKRSFVTRNVDFADIKTLITGEVKPQAGDLVLCEVTRLRQHCRLEKVNGRRSRMFVKDKIIVAYGHRYAPDQFEGIIPNNLDACHLVAGGGIASFMTEKSPKVKPATEIQPLGLIGDKNGQIINLADYIVLETNHDNHSSNIPIVVVAGSSMNAGKTTTVANIIKGLSNDGYKVGAAKVTGTGSGGDLWHFIDAGVKCAIDFTDAGFATTYLMSNARLLKTFDKMVNHLKSKAVDIIVIEVADGILQRETKALLESKTILEATTAMLYTSGDSSSALFGTSWLENLGYDVLGISGVVSSNPLGSREVTENCDLPIIGKKELTQAGFGYRLFERLSKKIAAASSK
ncbi:MAG TPA: DUF1611 domain-containing protein [Oceanospirillales bacterium]|nr:DUF1611 domain-containing protein [Oceanospirillales bacterium]